MGIRILPTGGWQRGRRRKPEDIHWSETVSSSKPAERPTSGVVRLIGAASSRYNFPFPPHHSKLQAPANPPDLPSLASHVAALLGRQIDGRGVQIDGRRHRSFGAFFSSAQVQLAHTVAMVSKVGEALGKETRRGVDFVVCRRSASRPRLFPVVLTSLRQGRHGVRPGPGVFCR